ncbi:hypothetical protein NL676_028468 [Syzygium grande]|nr:hypothetical protein NL676_028468 [Syzygium grande]
MSENPTLAPKSPTFRTKSTNAKLESIEIEPKSKEVQLRTLVRVLRSLACATTYSHAQVTGARRPGRRNFGVRGKRVDRFRLIVPESHLVRRKGGIFVLLASRAHFVVILVSVFAIWAIVVESQSQNAPAAQQSPPPFDPSPTSSSAPAPAASSSSAPTASSAISIPTATVDAAAVSINSPPSLRRLRHQTLCRRPTF